MSGTMTMLVPEGDTKMAPGWYVATPWPDGSPEDNTPTLDRLDIIWVGPYKTRADAVRLPETVQRETILTSGV